MKELTKRFVLAAALAAPLVLAGPHQDAVAEEPGHAAHPAPAAKEEPAGAPLTKDVLGKLHHANQTEIEMGKLAKENGQSAEVKGFGDTLVNDHTAADEKVAALARKKDVDLSAATPPMENVKDMVPPGPSFDKDFSKMMVEDHKKDIEAVKSARDQTSDPDLKTLLTDLLPTLEKHLGMAEKTAGH